MPADRIATLLWNVEEKHLCRAIENYLRSLGEDRFVLIALQHRHGKFNDDKRHPMAVFVFRPGETIQGSEVLKRAQEKLPHGPLPGVRIKFFTADGPEDELDFALKLLDEDGITNEYLLAALKMYKKQQEATNQQ